VAAAYFTAETAESGAQWQPTEGALADNAVDNPVADVSW
jgi:hypothetical protein